VFLQVQKLKEQAELLSWQPKSNKPGKPGQKRRNNFVKEEDRIK
jgi:hypothetical protein